MSESYVVTDFIIGFELGHAVTEIVPGDFNGDGIADIAINHFNWPFQDQPIPIRILLGNEFGGFEDATEQVFDGPIPGTVHGRRLVVADFNGDGVEDIFIADHGYDVDPFPGAPNVLILSDGKGRLVDQSANLPRNGERKSDGTSTGGFSHTAAAGDVDRDGDLDLYVGNVYGMLEIPPQILLNDGSGDFALKENAFDPDVLDLTNVFDASLLVDLDLDGDLDLVLGGHAGAPNRVYFNDGAGSFAGSGIDLPQGVFAEFSTYDIRPIDLNGDAFPDLALQIKNEPDGNHIQLLVNSGGTSFIDETASRLPQPDPEALPWRDRLLIIDIDRDGDMDILSHASNATLYRNDGTRHFATEANYASIPDNNMVAVVDLFDDGDWDIIEYDAVGTILVHHGNASPTGPNVIVDPADETNDAAIVGTDGADHIDANFGFDTLIGGAGDDLLDGGEDQDVMLGGEGNDVYFVNETFDFVDEGSVPEFREFGFGGADTIVSTANWYWDFYSVAERLVIAWDASDPSGAGTTMVGGIWDNEIIGNAGTNILFGRGGSDIYRAGDGVDWISLSTLGVTDENAYAGVNGNNTVIVDPRSSGAFSYDIVFEFESGRDRLDVSAYGYSDAEAVMAAGVDDGLGSSYYALGDGLDYLYLVGLTVDDVTAADFIV